MIEERLEGVRLIDGIHRNALHVLGQRCLGGVVGIDETTRDRIVARNRARLRQQFQRRVTAGAGHDLELILSTLLHRKILQKAMCGDRGRQRFDVRLRIGFAHIRWRSDELVEWDHLHRHGKAPFNLPGA